MSAAVKATHNTPEIFPLPSIPQSVVPYPKHPSSPPLTPKPRSRGKCSLPLVYGLFPGCPHRCMAELCMLQECSLLFFCDRRSQGQLLGRGLCLSVFPLPLFFLFFFYFYLCPQFPVFFLPISVSVDSSSGGGFRGVLSDGFVSPCFCWIAVIKARCLVFRGPSAAARLQSEALYTFVALSLLPHPGHGPFCLEATLQCVLC